MDFRYILKRLQFDKKVGVVLFFSSFIFLYYSITNKYPEFLVVHVLSFILCFYCGMTIYLDCKYIYPIILSISKIDRVLLNLHKTGVSDIDTIKVLYDMHIYLNNSFLPILNNKQEHENLKILSHVVKYRKSVFNDILIEYRGVKLSLDETVAFNKVLKKT